MGRSTDPRLYAHISVAPCCGPHRVTVGHHTFQGTDTGLKPMVRKFLEGPDKLTVQELREALQAAHYVTRTMLECLDQEYP